MTLSKPVKKMQYLVSFKHKITKNLARITGSIYSSTVFINHFYSLYLLEKEPIGGSNASHAT